MSKDVHKTNMWPAFENVRKLQKSSILYRDGWIDPVMLPQPASRVVVPRNPRQNRCKAWETKLKLMFKKTMGSPSLYESLKKEATAAAAARGETCDDYNALANHLRTFGAESEKYLSNG